ncbi:EMP3 protein, partial [Bucco capensis]|nr:EMP3 protein [Bucco capensis]
QAWWVLPDEEKLNLWYDCVYHNSSSSWVCASLADNPWLQGVQGLLVGALLLSGVSLLLFVWQLQLGPRGSLFVASGCTQLLAGLGVLLGAGLYATHRPRPAGGHFGHCFVLAWLAAAAALANGVTYLHLRKKQ